jgi:hypothetical protein
VYVIISEVSSLRRELFATTVFVKIISVEINESIEQKQVGHINIFIVAFIIVGCVVIQNVPKITQ